MLLGHEGVVLALFESHLNRDVTAVEVHLPMAETNGQQGRLSVFEIDEGPELLLLQTNTLNLSNLREYVIKVFLIGLSGKRPNK